MPHVLPNISDEVLIRYGVPQLFEALPQLFTDRPWQEKRVIAICDSGVDRSENQYDLWKNAKEIPDNGIDDDNNGYPDDVWGWDHASGTGEITDTSGHAQNCARVLTAPCPELIAVMNQVVKGSYYSILEAMRYAADNGALASSASYGITHNTLMPQTIEHLKEKGCFWLAPTNAGTEFIGSQSVWPASFLYDVNQNPPERESFWPHVSVTIAVNLDGQLRSDWSSVEALYAAYSETPSWAGPQPGSVLAMLKTLDPTLTIWDLKDLLVAGCAHTASTDGRCKYGFINHLRSVEVLLGHPVSSTPVPVPPPPEEPEQPPEEPPMTEYDEFENEFIQVRCPKNLVNGKDNPLNAHNEGLANMFADNTAKTLFLVPEVPLEVTFKVPGTLEYYRTANDAPNRDLSQLFAGEQSVDFRLISSRHTERAIGLHVEAEEMILGLKNFGVDPWGRDYIQLEYLKFTPDPVEAPEPEVPPVDPVDPPEASRTIVKIVNTVYYSDGTTEVFPK